MPDPEPKTTSKPKSKPRPKAASNVEDSSPRLRGRRSTLVLLLLGLALVGALFAFVYPTRTYLHQRRELNAAERQLGVLQDTTKALKHDSEKLQDRKSTRLNSSHLGIS